MKPAMIVTCLVSLCLGVGLFSNAACCGSRTEDLLGVAVSPQTLILSQVQGGTVTVHTAILARDVNAASLKLNGIAVSWTHVDNHGQIVGEFDESAVKAIVSPPEAALTLTGTMKSGAAFSGSDTVRVIP
ncbi:MAG: hypothetical protein GX580_05085 [Candidatus Hydrogenedens sp.]|nr:hypothetical protein [Candidatus Hydrogenedentota bacterium]NLF56991.1 hypothetical protein [Candidatus Hydrogenedens sp.]